jgi:hypothetical protein
MLVPVIGDIRRFVSVECCGLNYCQLAIHKTGRTVCFIINFQVNIMILSREFCVYLHFTPLFTYIHHAWRKHSLRKRQSKFL